MLSMVFPIFMKEVRLILKDKSVIFWLFLLPILFIVIFAAVFSSTAEDRGAAIAQIVPGYTVMFVFFIMISMVQGFLRERDSGMLARLRGTRLTSLQLLLGMWLPHVLVLLIQSSVLLGFGYLVYGLQLGNALTVACLVLALALCATGLGLALSMVVSSLNAAIAVVQIVAMGGAVLGGLWFPFDMLPEAVQAIGRFTPQHWALQALQASMSEQAGLGTTVVVQALLLLVAIGAIGMTVAAALYGRFAAKGV